mgnify:CR=1 FL=1
MAGGYQRFRTFGRHKTRQNVRLPEITQPPCGGGNNADNGRAGKQTAVFLTRTRGDMLDGRAHLVGSAQAQIHHHRR